MKKIILMVILLLYSFVSIADYTDSLKTNINELQFSSTNGYDIISFEDMFFTKEIGAPQLPVKILRIVIPIDKKVSNILINDTNTIQLNGIYNILPVQTSPKINNFSQFPFDNPNPLIYSSTSPYPNSIIEILSDEYPMGYHVISLIVYPIQYSPLNKTIKLFSNISFKLVFTDNSDKILLPDMQSQTSYDISKGYVKSLITNKSDLFIVSGGAKEVINNTNNLNLKTMFNTNISFIPDYIIITDPSFVNSFQPLANWKTEKGVYTMIVTTTDIYNNYQGFDNVEKIRSFLKDIKRKYGSTYLLLGGDVDIIPTRFIIGKEGGNIETNYYYAAIQSDNWNINSNQWSTTVADMSLCFFVGRAPVNTIAQVSNFVGKVIDYEKMNDNSLNINYLKNISFWSGYYKGSSLTTYYPMTELNKIDNSISGCINPFIYSVLKLYDKPNLFIGENQFSNRYFNLNRNHVLSSLNNGWQNFGQNFGKIHLFYHCDHSGFDALGTSTEDEKEHVYISDMDALNNGKYHQILYSDGCETNKFSLNSIPEHYINRVNGGGVAYIGNSDVGIWGDEIFFKRFCKTLYDVTQRSDAYDNKYYHIGFANQQSVFAATEVETKFRMTNRNLLGDPEMVIWTNVPKYLTVTTTNFINKQITVNVSNIDISNAPNNKVIITICVYKAKEIFMKKEILAITTALSETFFDIEPDTPGDLSITVTAQNYIPKTLLIPVSISGSHPYLTDIQINDDNINSSQGNNDLKANTGETIELSITLANSGNLNASNVSASIVWQPKPYQSNNAINLINGFSTFGNIPNGSSVNNNSNPFVIHINKDAFDNIYPRLTQYINFKLDIHNGNEHIIKYFDIEITEPFFENIDFVKYGNLSSGSTNQLKITLDNIGRAQATDITASLKSLSSNVNISYPSIISYGNINPLSSSVNNTLFQFNMLSNAYSNELFELTVKNQYNKEWVFNFNITQPFIDHISSIINHEAYSSSINLNWNLALLSSGSITGYNIYRSESSFGPYQKINNTKLNSPFFIDYTIQPLKYYYYKVSFIDDYFNESDLFPSDGYKACTVIPFHTGWPIVPTNYLGTTANGSPNIIDINSDGKKEIFFSTGSSTGAEGDKKGGLWAFNHDGTELFLSQNAINGFVDLQCDNQSTLAIDDINGDTKFEVAITTGNNPDNINIQKLFVYSSTEDIDNNYLPDELYNADISYLNVRGPVISDINNDGFKEIITNSAWDGINIYKNDGSLYKSINGFKSGYGMPVTFDFDSDGKKEIVTGCSNSPQYNSGILIFKEDGTPYNTNSPVVYSPPTSGFRTDFSPIICDIDNDNTYEILFISAKNKDAYLYAIKPDGTMVTGWEDNNVNHLSHIIELSNSVQTSDDIYNGQSGPNFSVGDINRDGKIEIVIGSKMKLYIFNGDGTLNNMINIPTYYSSAQKAPLIADIDSDHSDLEIIITDDINNNNKLSHIYAFKINGDIVKGFPITLDYNIKISNTPCIADVDNDDKNELFVSSALKFYLWDTEGSSYLNDWGSYRHDANNSGVLFNRECLVSNTVIEINSNNEQWLDYKQINSTLIINSGAKLTIKGYVDINPVSKIIVKPGAQLILDGCVLNSACPGQLWKGIEVMGDYTKSQLPISNQGYVALRNGAIIKDAETGIMTTSNPNITLKKRGGGIINAENAKFIDNKIAVSMSPYQNFSASNPAILNNDLSYFRYCTFETKGKLKDANVSFDAFVDLYNVNGIPFTSCTFVNPLEATNAFTGTGIRSSNSSFRVNAECSQSVAQGCLCPEQYIVRSQFKNLQYGIKANNYNSGKIVTITESNFENNERGVYLNATKQAYITRNTVKVKDFHMPQTFVPYGMYLNYSTGYIFEGNSFDKASATNPGTIGLIINNSGADQNMIYNNTFSNLYCATDAQNNNKKTLDGIEGDGLKIKCNDYLSSNNFDIGITPNGCAGISKFQGTNTTSDPKLPAGNTFSANAYQLNNGGEFFNYFHHASNVNNLILVPTNISGNITLQPTIPPYVDKTISCPAQALALNTQSGLSANIFSKSQQLNSAKLMLTIWVDGGNTQALKDAVNLSYPWEAFELYNNLISKSPYLSDEVMIDAIKREDVLPALMLKYILLANPQAVKSQKVWDALYHRNDPFPDAWIDELKQGADIVSPREQLEAQVSYYAQQRQLAVNELKYMYLSDSTAQYPTDSLIALLSTDIEATSDYQLAEYYMQKADFISCETILENIPSKYAYGEEEQMHHTDYMSYYTIIKDVIIKDKDLSELSESQRNKLIALSETSKGIVSAYARSILSVVSDNYSYEEPVFLPDPENRLKSTKPENSQKLKEENLLKAFPNPANEFFIVEFDITERLNNARLEIIDATGRKLQSIELKIAKGQKMILTKEMAKGLYHCYLINDNKIIKQAKISKE